MDDYRDEIDEIFRGRFDGLKNWKYDPALEWKNVQVGLSTRVASASATTGGSFIIAQKIAATLFVAVLSTVGINESSLKDIPTAYTEAADVQSLELSPLNSFAPEITEVNNSKIVSQNLVSDFKEVLIAEESNFEATSLVDVSNLQNAQEVIVSNEMTKAGELSDTKIARQISHIDLIASRKYAYQAPGIEDPRYIPTNPTIKHWKSDHIWFFRGGVRTGTGESNSAITQSAINLDPFFSFGYGLAITDRSYVSAEVGVLRRSGNAIERVTQSEVNPIVASLTNATSNEMDIMMHRGLVAYQMDYVHVPIMFNYIASSRWNVSIGAFADYMFAAKNESITVYNARDYVSTSSTSSEEIASLEGLNRVRYGAVIGAERQFTEHLYSFARVMTPINAAIDESDGYESFGSPNRLIDAQFGLMYQF